MANLVRDVRILQDARAAAFELIEKDPEFKRPEHLPLKEKLNQMLKTWVG